MRIIKAFFAGILCFSFTGFIPASCAGSEFTLVGGNRAVIEGKQLILIGQDSRRSVAPSGQYDTRDGRYSIVVKGNDIAKGKEIVILDHTKELR